MRIKTRNGSGLAARGLVAIGCTTMLLASAAPAAADLLADGTFSYNFTNSGGSGQVYLNAALIDNIPLYFGGSCFFSSGSVPVVSGTTATYTAMCGSLNVAATLRLLSPLPSLPTTSGGIEFEYVFTNGTGGAIPLEAMHIADTDVLLFGSNVAFYDATAKAVVNTENVTNPSGLFAMIASTDQPGATYGWDVDVLPNASTSFPTDNAVGPVGPTDTHVSIGYAMNIPPGDSATVRFRVMYARGVLTAPADFDFSSCYSSPRASCRGGTKSILALKDNVDNSKDKLLWKLSGADATSQTDFSDPSVDGDYSLCVYENGAHLSGAHVAASASLWTPLPGKGFKYGDVGGTSDGIGKALLKGSDQAKTKILVKGSGINLPDPALGALLTPVTVQMHNGGQPGICWDADFVSTIKNDIAQFKAKAP